MDWAVAFGAGLRMSVVERRGLVLDTRFVPASPEPASESPCLYLVLEGSWQAGEISARGPAAFVVSQAHLEGSDGARSLLYRTDPVHFALIELHLDPAGTSLRAAALPTPVVLDDRAWRAAQRVASLREHDDESLVAACGELLAALVALSLMREEAAASALKPVTPAFRLLWKALRPMAERLDLLPTVQQISGAIGVSPREVDRHVRAFLSASGLVGSGWRPASRHLRLKLAVIMLSADEASIGDVARVIGYGSVEAMARAFRDAELPSPLAVREAVRAAR